MTDQHDRQHVFVDYRLLCGRQRATALRSQHVGERTQRIVLCDNAKRYDTNAEECAHVRMRFQFEKETRFAEKRLQSLQTNVLVFDTFERHVCRTISRSIHRSEFTTTLAIQKSHSN